MIFGVVGSNPLFLVSSESIRSGAPTNQNPLLDSRQSAATQTVIPRSPRGIEL